MGRRSKEQGTVDKFVDLRAQGKPYEEIAKELNVDEATLIVWSGDYSETIKNLRAVRYEAIQSQGFATKEKRVELIGNRIDAIKKELEKRDLSTLNTRELEELLLKYVALQDKWSESVTFTVRGDSLDFDLQEKRTWEG